MPPPTVRDQNRFSYHVYNMFISAVKLDMLTCANMGTCLWGQPQVAI